ncbi:hypothetical protein HPB48_017158 [Haemaphysalis longicornis]|uniref:Serine/threonine specific protein phosphatases domain-containing protein n=1 Tax=Haemaphysalis longicornis TaxID=44386 RepID=A0A9J6GCJ7_HAELO|nr:hypothetical protein HPB48_017158 [Haemaphysalis longicornis]
MGDCEDRRLLIAETFLRFSALKVRYPTRITLIRGNHQRRPTTQVFGFHDDNFGDVQRTPEVSDNGTMCDLLRLVLPWRTRGLKCALESDVVSKFKFTNNIDFICRTHEFVVARFERNFKKSVLTDFSTTNCGDVAAILELH